MADANAATIVWLGHATLLFTSPRGTRLVVDPWLEGNPVLPDRWRTIDRADAILVTHGHFDHLTDAAPLARALGAPTVSNPEVAAYLASQGVEQRIEINKGGSIELAEIVVTMVSADHSSGITAGDGQPNLEGGEPAGFVVRGADFSPVYVAGDTGVFGDMRIVRELYGPVLGVLPIDGHYNMGPVEAAYACELLGIAEVLPVHWGTFPIFKGTPEGLEQELARRGVTCRVLSVRPGDAVPVPAPATTR